MRRFATLVLAAALAGVGLAACGDDDKAAEEIIEQLGGGSVDIDSDDGEIKIQTEDGDLTISEDGGSGSFTVEGEDGEDTVSFGSGAELPEDWPEDVPLPEDAEVQGSYTQTVDDQRTWTISLVVDGDAVEVTEAYRAAIEAAGFTIDSEMSGGSGSEAFASFSASNDDWMVNAITGSEGDQVVMNLMVAPNSAG
ncbi:MAG: hypothetical protein M5U14_14895 [Acidimicrobiia bacterium]|nr:hypothetical protein [Acidimicrobiia bacterium]